MTIRLHSYFTGILWFILSLVNSCINDIISKYTGMRLSSYEITFFRFFFGTITLLPFVVYYGKNTLKTNRPLVHFARGVLLFLGIVGWTFGLTIAPVTTATVISFTIPIFVLVLGVFFLSEKVIWQRWAVTLVVFLGLTITINPHTPDFNPKVLVFVLAALAFSMLDIINKIYVIKESMISMLFYSATVTSILALPFALQYWITPTVQELLLLFILGASANLILFFLLTAFTLADATALAPYRYLELIFSAIVAYLVFEEMPTKTTLYGAFVIIPATLFIIYSENQKINKKA